MIATRRAVLYVPPSSDPGRWIDACARYALQRRRTIACVCSQLLDAFGELIADRADLIIVATVDQIYQSPLVEVVAHAGSDDNPMTHRPELRRTGRIPPDVRDEELARPARAGAQVIPIRGRRSGRN